MTLVSGLFFSFPVQEPFIEEKEIKKEEIIPPTVGKIVEVSEGVSVSKDGVRQTAVVPIGPTAKITLPPQVSEVKMPEIPEITTPASAPNSKYFPIWESGVFDQAGEEELWRAVVKLECEHADKKATSIGSGVVLTKDGIIATNYHVVADAAGCKIIFPSSGIFNGNVIRPVYSLFGNVIKKADDGENYDIALLQMDPISSFSIDPSYNWKGNPYPYVPFSFCTSSAKGDKVIHYGWDSRSDEGNIIDRTKGSVTEFIRYSESENEFYYGGNEKSLYVWTDAHTNSGVSGGLGFNASRDCIFGLSSRIGGEPGNYRTWILNFGNPVIQNFLSGIKD